MIKHTMEDEEIPNVDQEEFRSGPEDESEESVLPPAAKPPSDEELLGLETMPPEQREARRLAGKPNIDHLVDGVYIDGDERIPLFDTGDRIVVERYASSLNTHPWLDTRVYTVKSINDQTGHVTCCDEEFVHHAVVSYKSPYQKIKLVPKKGPIFTRKKASQQQLRPTPPPVVPPVESRDDVKKMRRSRRPKDVILAEKAQRAAARAAKRLKREAKKR